MKTKAVFAALALLCALPVFAQAPPRLGVSIPNAAPGVETDVANRLGSLIGGDSRYLLVTDTSYEVRIELACGQATPGHGTSGIVCGVVFVYAPNKYPGMDDELRDGVEFGPSAGDIADHIFRSLAEATAPGELKKADDILAWTYANVAAGPRIPDSAHAPLKVYVSQADPGVESEARVALTMRIANDPRYALVDAGDSDMGVDLTCVQATPGHGLAGTACSLAFNYMPDKYRGLQRPLAVAAVLGPDVPSMADRLFSQFVEDTAPAQIWLGDEYLTQVYAKIIAEAKRPSK